jgi:hypothetical protein
MGEPVTDSLLLGRPLPEALALLEALGIGPVTVTSSQAPKRREGTETGALRVVRVLEGGRALTICAFAPAKEGGPSNAAL